MGAGGFPLFGVTLAGSRPGGRPTSLRRQRSRQERRPRRAGRLLKLSLDQTTPCAAHNRRPAQNSRAAPAQTAAPDIPACCCAARRLGRGFPESPRVSGRACVIDAKAKIPVSSLLTQEGRVSAAYPTPHSPMTSGASAKARCLLKAPSEPLIRGALGGAFRRSCLSPRSREFCAGRPMRAAQGVFDQATLEQKTGERGRLSCLLLWRRKEVGRRRGATRPM
jgi:hypothetical protein